MTRRYVQQLVRHRDREVCLSGLWVATGFAQTPIAVDMLDRNEHAYGPRLRLSALVNAL